MKALAAILSLLIIAVAAGADEPAKPKARKPNFTIGKETTYVTGPVDKDGYIDYAAALNDRMGKGVTPDTNANVLIWQAIGPTPGGARRMPAVFFKLMGMEEPPEGGEYFVSYKNFADSKEEREAFGREVNPFGKRPWSEAKFPARVKWLKANASALKLIVDATKRDRYFSPSVRRSLGMLSVPYPTLGPLTELGKALTARAMLRLSEGKTDEAWSDLLACHRLGRLLGQSSGLVGGFTSARLAGIAQSSETAFLNYARRDANELQVCLKDLRALPPIHTLAKQLDFERFLVLESMMLTDQFGPWYIGEISGLPRREVQLSKTRLANIDWDPSLKKANEWYDELAGISLEKERVVRERRFKQIQSKLQELAGKYAFIGINDLPKEYLKRAWSPKSCGELLGDYILRSLYPAAWKAQQSIDRTEQSMRNLQVAFALVAFEREHKGDPKALGELAPKYFDKIPVDLYTGKPLMYRPSEKGFLVYSFGPDGKDDEGRTLADKPPGDDIVVRMPIPELQRK